MKEKNYTIPINESFELKSGCPLCRLYEKTKEKTLDYITGAAMMEPDVRQETNRQGFCHQHFSDMLKLKNRLSLALMLESHMDVLEKVCFEDTKGFLGRANDPIKTADALAKADQSCFVCRRIDEYMGHYYSNIVYLWKSEPVFKRRFAEQEAFCIPHLHKLLEQAKKSLSKRDLPDFVKDAVAVTRKRHTELRADLAKFTKSFDYRFAEEGKAENVKNSVENVIAYLAALGR
ncbi:MAG TPA: hypothetical protein GX701_04280 [Clostridiales bacterium]|jgi:hypothetical protein|nr:hypothetical protein [Clostridiales bacterium]